MIKEATFDSKEALYTCFLSADQLVQSVYILNKVRWPSSVLENYVFSLCCYRYCYVKGTATPIQIKVITSEG